MKPAKPAALTAMFASPRAIQSSYRDRAAARRSSCQLDYARRWCPASDCRCHLSHGSVRGWNATAYQHVRRVCVSTGSGLRVFHTLSLADTHTGAPHPSGAGSFSNLSVDRGDLYPVHLGLVTRTLGMDSVLHCVGISDRWRSLQVFCCRTLRRGFCSGLHPDGLDCRSCNRSLGAGHQLARNRLDHCRRNPLHVWRPVLRSRSAPLLSCSLACVCFGG
jgi:hypothetical protein